MPEQQHAMRASLEARAVDGVGFAVADRAQQGGQLGRIVLEVGVLRHDHITGGGGDAALERGALAAIGGVTDHVLHQAVLAGQPVEDGAGAVGRRVVHDDHFKPQRDLPELTHRGFDRRRLVVRRHDDRQQHVVAGGAP